MPFDAGRSAFQIGIQSFKMSYRFFMHSRHLFVNLFRCHRKMLLAGRSHNRRRIVSETRVNQRALHFGLLQVWML